MGIIVYKKWGTTLKGGGGGDPCPRSLNTPLYWLETSEVATWPPTTCTLACYPSRYTCRL